MGKRDEYIEIMKQQLDTLNSQMGEWETKANEVKEETREKYTEQVAQLRKASQAANEKLEEIVAAGEDKWEALVEEAEKVHKAFLQSFPYFQSQFQ